MQKQFGLVVASVVIVHALVLNAETLDMSSVPQRSEWESIPGIEADAAQERTHVVERRLHVPEIKVRQTAGCMQDEDFPQDDGVMDADLQAMLDKNREVFDTKKDFPVLNESVSVEFTHVVWAPETDNE